MTTTFAQRVPVQSPVHHFEELTEEQIDEILGWVPPYSEVWGYAWIVRNPAASSMFNFERAMARLVAFWAEMRAMKTEALAV